MDTLCLDSYFICYGGYRYFWTTSVSSGGSNKRPFASLIPGEEGHWLKLKKAVDFFWQADYLYG